MSLRVKLAGGVLAMLAVLSGCAFAAVRQICTDLLQMQTRAERTVIENSADARQAVMELTEAWQQRGTVLQFLVAGNVLGELDGSMNRLVPMLDAECDELSAELAAVKSNLKWIYCQEIMIL